MREDRLAEVTSAVARAAWLGAARRTTSNFSVLLEAPGLQFTGRKRHRAHPLLPLGGRGAAQRLANTAEVDETELSHQPEPENMGGETKQAESLRKHNRAVVSSSLLLSWSARNDARASNLIRATPSKMGGCSR